MGIIFHCDNKTHGTLIYYNFDNKSGSSNDYDAVFI